MVPLRLVCSHRSRVSGYALGGTSEPESQLAPFIQQAIDQVRTSSRGDRLCRTMLTACVPWQINFVIGDPATSAPGIV